uniref:Uncharacterized protein n=1 Tax=Arundo donax TaxID=35708 RepID=A0A0A8XX27_ARUDO
MVLVGDLVCFRSTRSDTQSMWGRVDPLDFASIFVCKMETDFGFLIFVCNMWGLCWFHDIREPVDLGWNCGRCCNMLIWEIKL